MIRFSGHGILLDIEGTTSSIHFVYDEMFPYVRRELDRFLTESWPEPVVQRACRQIAKDAGYESVEQWRDAKGLPDCDERSPRRLIRDEVVRLMDRDEKSTGLKSLQGLIWRAGFESGELKAHLFDDVWPALQSWHQAGRDIRIYSSGSVEAQKLFFCHTQQGDVLSVLRGHYDTTTGPKREAASYRAIAADFQLAPADILFLSDIVAELDAAAGAGLQTGLCLRPGNASVPAGHRHTEFTSFAQIKLA